MMIPRRGTVLMTHPSSKELVIVYDGYNSYLAKVPKHMQDNLALGDVVSLEHTEGRFIVRDTHHGKR